MARDDIEGMSSLRAWPKGREPERAIPYLHGGAYCVGSWRTHGGPSLLSPLPPTLWCMHQTTGSHRSIRIRLPSTMP
jgi:acetyl esterase/lipase